METLEELTAALEAGSSELERLYFENLQDEMAADLVLAHIKLMLDAGEPIPASLLALEALILRNKALSP